MQHRVGLAVAIGLGLGFGLFQLGQSFDGDAYWQAAQRVRDGLPLYAPGAPSDPLVYRYPPWFAWAWVPLTYLPQGLVMAVWRLALVGCALSLVRLAPRRAWMLWLFVPMLVAAGWQGNVQPLVVLLAVSGPAWALGVAGGIKALPLLLLPWRWRGAALTLAVAGIGWATILLASGDYPAPRPPWPTDLALLLAFNLRPSVERVSPTGWSRRCLR